MNDRKRLLIMLPVLAVAAWLALFGDKSPVENGEAVISAVEPNRSAVGGLSPKGEISAVPPAVVTTQPGSAREGIKLALSEATPLNLFAGSQVAAAPSPAGDEETVVPPAPQFVVIGSMLKDGRFNVFLDKDNQTYVATPGVVIDGNRVDVVKSDQVQLFNLSTKTTQIIPIEGEK